MAGLYRDKGVADLPAALAATDGCWASRSCLACPLPACKDDPPGDWPDGYLGKIAALQQHWEDTGHSGRAPMDSHEARRFAASGTTARK